MSSLSLIIWVALSPALLGQAALEFSGGQVLSVSSLPLGPHTLEAWVKPAGPLPLGTRPHVILDWDGRVVVTNSLAGLSYSLDLGGLAEPAPPGPPEGARSISVPALPPGEWHHLAAVFDGARMFLLVDGRTAAVASATGTLVGGEESPAAFGAPLSSHPGSPYSGTLDELRLWGKRRSEEEIVELIADHLPLVLPPDIIAYWDLDSGTGPAAGDWTGAHSAMLGDLPGPDARDPVWTTDTAPVRRPDFRWSLAFRADGSTALGSGKPIDVSCLLSSAGGTPGVTAWTIAVRHDRPRLVLEDASLVDTAAEDRKGDGFAKLELVDDGSSAGFVSQVVLSAAGSSTLPVGEHSVVARARYRGMLNFVDSALTFIHYDDRLPPGKTLAPLNVVTTGGTERLPAEGRLAFALSSPAFTLALEPERATVPPGSEVEVACVLTTTGNTAPTGPSAWSIGVSHHPDLMRLVDVTTSGTVLDEFAGGVFKILERVDDDRGSGFIAVAILNLGGTGALPPNGRAVIARARYQVRLGVDLESHLEVEFRDGMAGSGEPLDNQVDFIGGSQRPLKSNLTIRVARPIFLRGDTNVDRLYNIADVIFILESLFRGGALPRCLDSADVNDDSGINITDAIFLLQHLFQGGVAPPPPWPEPGEDQTQDGLSCLDYPLVK